MFTLKNLACNQNNKKKSVRRFEETISIKEAYEFYKKSNKRENENLRRFTLMFLFSLVMY